jgi:beta-lactamase superfamily II metal-dependent hydrolase
MATTRAATATLIGVIAAFASGAAGQTPARDPGTLDIYVIDVEGGNATLFVSPSRESLLIDTGNGGVAAPRDASRVADAARDARLSRIDHLITTHWHGDHVGGLAELATRLPIAHFIDHGDNVQPGPEIDAFLRDAYPKLYAKGQHTIARPGDAIPISGLDVRIVSSAGRVLTAPLPGAGAPNPYCATFKATTNSAEDAQSVGTHVTFGRFRALHLGDLPTKGEFDLMCPNTRVGPVDVLLGLHHGQDTSNAEVLVHAVRPRVAIMNNGTRKGGWPAVMKTLYTSPGLEDLWQMHFSMLSGQEYTVPGLFIANGVDDQPAVMPIAPAPLPSGANAPPPPAHEGSAYWIKVSAHNDGSFTVSNTRNGFSKAYQARARSPQ